MSETPNFSHLHYKTLDSTHLWCKRERKNIEALLLYHDYVIVSAEGQTQGQGRQATPWLGEKGNVYFNLNLIDPIDSQSGSYPQLCSLGLAVTDALSQVLHAQGVPSFVKWPNDLVTPRGKLGGILVERLLSSAGYNSRICDSRIDDPTVSNPRVINSQVGNPRLAVPFHWLTIGIGLNIFPLQLPLDEPVSCCLDYGFLPQAVEWIPKLAEAIYGSLKKLSTAPLDMTALFAQSFTRKGQKIQLTLLEKEPRQIKGEIQSIDEQGCLHLIDEEGTIFSITSGQCRQVRTLDS